MSDLNLPTAPLWRRLVAMLYDLLNILGISLLLAAILIPSCSHLFNNGEPLGEMPVAVSASYFFSITFLFYMVFWRRNGQTLGMKVWKICLVTELQDRSLGTGQCMLRVGIGFFSLMLGGIGYWWMLWDKQEKTWHDHASFTRVVYKP